MEALHGVINDINSFLWTYVIIIALIGSGVVYTLRTKFVQVRLLGEMIRLIFGSAGQKNFGQGSQRLSSVLRVDGVAGGRRQHCGRCDSDCNWRLRSSVLDVDNRLYRLRDWFR